MSTILYVAQIIVAITLVALVTIQSIQSGAGSMFGGDTSFRTTRRGLERTLFQLTAVVSAIFFILAIISTRLSL